MTSPARNIRLLPQQEKYLDRMSHIDGMIYYDKTNQSLRLQTGEKTKNIIATQEWAEPILDTKAPINNPTFTGTVSGVTATMVGLGNVTNESKSTMFTDPTFTGTVSGVTASMVGLGNVTNESKATMFADPTFTGTVSGVTATMVGLGNVTNESKATMFDSPTFTGQVTLPGAAIIPGYATEGYVSTIISNLVDAAPATLDTLNELAAALNDDANFAATVTTALGTKAPVENPTFNGVVTLGVQQLVFDRTVGDNWIGSSVVIENGNISVFEPPTGFYNWLISLEPGDKFTIQPGGQELTVASTNSSNPLTFLITTEEVIDETPGEGLLTSFWITSFTQTVGTAEIVGVTKAMVGLGNVTNESKATMFTDPTFTGLTTTGNLTVNGTASLTLPSLTVDPETLVINNTAATGLYNGSITGQLRLAPRVTNGLGSSNINITPNVLANSTAGQPINNLLPVTFGVNGETYIVDAEFILTTTGTISHTERVGITTPPNSFFEAVITRETITGTTASTINVHRITAPGTTVITGAITTAQTARYTVRVIYTATATDTFQINVSFSAAPGGTSTIIRSIQSARVISEPGLSIGSFFGAV
jgi:hypothetical protein